MTVAAHEPRIARIAALLADPARSRMLAYLLSGEHASAGELARVASVSAATASGHLKKLLDQGLLVCEARGRHRYFRLAGPDVAHALEALALLAERDAHERAWQQPARMRLREARCCYGHLAGRLGVAWYEALQRVGGLAPGTDGYTLTAAGSRWLSDIGFAPTAPTGRRRYAYACLDWSERRDHLAGQLADEFLHHCLERGWLRRDGGRALTLTPPGQRDLAPALALASEQASEPDCS